MAQDPARVSTEEKSDGGGDNPVWVISAANVKPTNHTYNAIDDKVILKKITKKRVFGYELDDSSKVTLNANKTSLISADLVDHKTIPNVMIQMLHSAFMRHLPVQLRPDDLWLLICQGIAIHIFENAEKLRKHIVDFDGKQKIVVRDDKLDINSDSNDWSYSLDQFNEGCAKLCKLKNFIKTLECDFGTSTRVTNLAAKCTVFKGMSKYIDFYEMTMSGIPQIRLVGSVKDWESILKKLKSIDVDALQLNWWFDKLEPTLKNIIATVETLAAKKELSDELNVFWKSIYRYMSASGGDTITGWIVNMFPYLTTSDGGFTRSRFDQDWGTKPGCFGPTYTKAPLMWNYLGKEIECDMIGGIVGIAQDTKDTTLMPVSAWMIVESDR